jgi:hypothetical protein
MTLSPKANTRNEQVGGSNPLVGMLYIVILKSNYELHMRNSFQEVCDNDSSHTRRF